MHVFEGTIINCTEAGKTARFLVEAGGRIRFVGDKLPEEFAAVPRTQLGKRALIPAFADSHLHFVSFASVRELDLRDADTIASQLEMLAAYHARYPHRVVLAFGASAHRVAEGRLPVRVELDTRLPGVPVMVIKYDGHASILSSEMLLRLPPRTASLRGYNGESGHLGQEAFFAASEFVTRSVSTSRLMCAMLAAGDELARHGIGLIHAAEGVGFWHSLDVDLVRFFARGLKNAMGLRIYFQTMAVDQVLRRGLPRIGGCFTAALDGAFGSQDAALNEPYANSKDNRGVLYYDQKTVSQFVRDANRAGLQVAVHAIGDAAFDQAVQAFADALADHSRRDHRHIIIHACLVTQRGLDTAAKLGLCIAAQPAFNEWELEPTGYLTQILGERAKRLNPIATMRRGGLRVAGGSDAPCTLPDPLAGIRAACLHPNASERLTVGEALLLFTRDAAYLSFDEKERGTLEAGKRADYVVLSENPLSLSPDELRRVKVESTTLAGVLYRPGQSIASLLLRGLACRSRDEG
jgi:predicted amidohydrolase YtcJ